MHILRRPFRGKMTNTPVGLGDGRYSDRPFRKRYPLFRPEDYSRRRWRRGSCPVSQPGSRFDEEGGKRAERVPGDMASKEVSKGRAHLVAQLGRHGVSRRFALQILGLVPARGILCAPARKTPGLTALKKDPPEEFSYAIRRIMTGGFYVPISMSLFLRDHPDHASALDHLTQRERSVLALYAQGYTIKEIAGELNVSVKTAETHRSKLGHPNRSQITALSTYLRYVCYPKQLS